MNAIVHLIAAARPNFMKVAPLFHALTATDWCEPQIVHLVLRALQPGGEEVGRRALHDESLEIDGEHRGSVEDHDLQRMADLLVERIEVLPPWQP